MKVSKYATITATHDFVPLAFETLGPLSSAATAFISSLGKRLSVVTGDTREEAFLFQPLSMAIQRFSSVALHDTFASSETEDQ